MALPWIPKSSAAASPPLTSRMRPFEEQCAPLAARVRTEIFKGRSSLDWPTAIDRLTARPGGAVLVQKCLSWGLSVELLLRWVCLAARLEETASRRSPPSMALVLAERWLGDGAENLRYQAYDQAQLEEFSSPASMAAMAAFASGPSMAPQGAPKAPPGPSLARSVSTGVLATVSASEVLGDDGFSRVNSIGLELAGGGDGRKAARAALHAVSL